MTAADFDTFYEAVHGYPPFPWQSRLARTVAADRKWPSLLALPTASGKTSVIDIAVFTLALEAERPLERIAPLRMFFVVDRRLVVDEAERHALSLRDKLERPGHPVIAEVKTALLRFGTAEPLHVASLRGGMYRSDTWADEPNQPLVCISTVDQIGSRLLFRGYGISDSRRPIHAGLIGCDGLVVLDEAHLSQPFLDTLRAVQQYEGEAWAEASPKPPLQIVEMTATPRRQGEIFALDQKDYENQELAKRLGAVKTAELRECAGIEKDAIDEALRLASLPNVNVTGVIVNTVNTARTIYEALREKAILLTGRIRPWDRDRLLKDYLDRIKTSRDRAKDQPLFVVATQTIEVGADLDFDALVSEAAPIDALRQRFGRLDRRGELSVTRSVILKRKRAKALDWIYGERLDKTWKWLNERAVKNTPPAVDFGILSMAGLLKEYPAEDLTSPHVPGPVLFPAHLDSWVQTNPEPDPDPDVAPFLHGPDAQPGDVQIVWRADLGDREGWFEILMDAPPLTREAMPLPLSVAWRWLNRQDRDTTDLEGIAEADDSSPGEERREYLIWRGPRDTDPKDYRLRPGATIIVRSSEGGADRFGWNPASRVPVEDIGDLCANERAGYGLGRYRIRVHPDVLFPPGEAESERDQLKELLERYNTEEDEEALDAISDLVRKLEHLGAALEILNDRPRSYGSENGLLWVAKRTSTIQSKRACPDISPEDDDKDESNDLRAQRTLRAHTQGVKKRVLHYAEACGLAPALCDALGLTADLHDLGKCDSRFQMMLDPLRPRGAEPLAKGDGKLAFREYRARRDRAGYPERSRHEFASVALAKESSALKGSTHRELVLHLIGTHHGYGRSLAPFWIDAESPKITAPFDGELLTAQGANQFARLDSGWCDQFWSLVSRYGYWGLAYLEAIMRRADCVQSREEEREESHTQ